MRVAKPVQLNAEDDRRLRILSKRKRVEARVQMRARIVLLAADGMSDKDIAGKLDTDRRVAARWRARFLAAGVDGLLQDATRPGRPRTARQAANVEQVVRITLEHTPKGATHWSTRTLATHLCTSASAVARIWRAHGLKPHGPRPPRRVVGELKGFDPTGWPRAMRFQTMGAPDAGHGRGVGA